MRDGQTRTAENRNKNKNGVALILNEQTKASIKVFTVISSIRVNENWDRTIRPKHHLYNAYAFTSESNETEIEEFYEWQDSQVSEWEIREEND